MENAQAAEAWQGLDLASLSECAQKIGGRSAEDWLRLGKRYVDVALSQLGVKSDSDSDFDHPNYFGSKATRMAASLRDGEIDYAEYATTLFEKRDPLDWLEGPPLLLRLAITKNDTKTLREILAR